MNESQYIEPYLDKTADPGTRWTPGTYLSYTLAGKAKGYSAHYATALMRAIRRREAAGEVIAVPSKGGSTAWIRKEDQS